MREVSTDEITKNIKEMCIEANYILSDDVKNKIINSAAVENSEIGKKILSQLEENMEIAEREQIPICQDTGMAVVFIKVGQEVHITYLPLFPGKSLYRFLWGLRERRKPCGGKKRLH